MLRLAQRRGGSRSDVLSRFGLRGTGQVEDVAVARFGDALRDLLSPRLVAVPDHDRGVGCLIEHSVSAQDEPASLAAARVRSCDLLLGDRRRYSLDNTEGRFDELG